MDGGFRETKWGEVMTKAGRTIIVGITGSIAAYKACEIVNILKKDAFDVKVILTEEAREFVTPLTLQTLSGNKVLTDMFEPSDVWSPVHTSLAHSASLVLIAPATANVIGKLAGGICDDLLTCVVYATKAPVLIAPAMNEKMYNHKIVQENIAKLKRCGYSFVGPVTGHLACQTARDKITGRLACGHETIGHIAEVSSIVKEAKRLLSASANNSNAGKRLRRIRRSTTSNVS